MVRRCFCYRGELSQQPQKLATCCRALIQAILKNETFRFGVMSITQGEKYPKLQYVDKALNLAQKRREQKDLQWNRIQELA